MDARFSSTFSSTDCVSGLRQFLDVHPSPSLAQFGKILILQSDWPPLGCESITLCACNTVVFVSTICSRLASSLIISVFGMVSLRTPSSQGNWALRAVQAPISLGWISQRGPIPS